MTATVDRLRPPLTCLFALCLLLPACSGKPTNPVSGKVFLDGKPCSGALVVFHPSGNKSPTAVRPSAVVKEDGSFRLTSDPRTPGDGAAPGEYVVAITWLAPPSGKLTGMGGGESKGNETDRLGGRYRDENVSQLKATVKAGKNELEPFQLK